MPNTGAIVFFAIRPAGLAMMSRQPLFAVLVCLAPIVTSAGEPPSQTEIEKLIVGKWSREEMIGDVAIKATTTYESGGKMSSEGTIVQGVITLNISVTGRWKVMGSKLIEIVEKANPPAIPIGHESVDEVLEINNKICRYKTSKGDERTKTRVGD